MDKAVGIQARNTCESLHNAVAHSGVKHMEVHWEEPRQNPPKRSGSWASDLMWKPQNKAGVSV